MFAMKLLERMDSFMGWGMAAAIGGSLLGNVLTNDSARSRAHDAQDFSAEQYAARWQTTVKDMQAAGLNPMLAYSQGVGSSPSGVQAPVADYGEAIGRGVSAANTYMQKQVNSAQVANIDADTENKKSQSALIDAQTQLALSSAGAANANIAQIQATTDKIVAETKNVPIEGDRLRAVIMNIAAQTGLTETQEVTQRYSWPQIQAITQKVLTEVGLNKLDLKAAQYLDNFGRNSKEMKPVIDLVKMLLSHSLKR